MSQELDSGVLTLLILIAYFYWAFDRWMRTPPPADTTAKQARETDRPFRQRIPSSRARDRDRALWARPVAAGSPAADALWTIRSAERSFDAERFLQGALAAYEAILLAFAKGDPCAFADLTAPEVYDAFTAAIAEREQQADRVEWALLRIDSAGIVAASMARKSASITVQFSSRFITSTAGAGEPEWCREVAVTDYWTFAREIPSRDPNWKLIATSQTPVN